MDSERYTWLRKLLDGLEAYQGEGSYEDFLRFALQQEQAQTAAINETIASFELDVQISIWIGKLAKFARLYNKKALDPQYFPSSDDFGYLAGIMYQAGISKSQLIQQNLAEYSTGADIIKRLVKKDLAREFPDPNDKRAKCVEITEKGQVVLGMAFQEMRKVSRMISGNLSAEEKRQLLQILTKVGHWHEDLYQRKNFKQENIDTLLAEAFEQLT